MEGALLNIAGLDKVELLRRLWNAQKTAPFFSQMSMTPPGFDANEAASAVRREIDYFAGRAIKMDLSKDVVNPVGYDRIAGAGQAAAVVAELRAGLPAKTLEPQRLCPDGSGRKFSPFGEAILPDKPDTVMCIYCGAFLRAH
jgi:hypothetical protein